ncbi:MAG: hypothetical protein IMZ55_18835 [Acidobacteria bacterium]|nr:hypothetical protein [Acidobacteriota bacterium]
MMAINVFRNLEAHNFVANVPVLKARVASLAQQLKDIGSGFSYQRAQSAASVAAGNTDLPADTVAQLDAEVTKEAVLVAAAIAFLS